MLIKKNVFDIADIEFAVLETSGKLSIQLKSINQPLTPKDMNLSTQYKGPSANLIIDGKILHVNLKIIGKDINWLNIEIQKQGINSPSNILLAYLDSSNVLNVHLKK